MCTIMMTSDIRSQVGDRKRIPYFDVIKGFLMITVVFDHILLFNVNNTDPLHYFIGCMFNSFNMPLFFMVSGYMLAFSGRKFLTWQPFSNHITKRVIQCLVPFFMWAIFKSLVFDYPSSKDVYDILLSVPRVMTNPSSGLWFLLCLFVIDSLLSIFIFLDNRVGKRSWLIVYMVLVEVALLLLMPLNIFGLYNVYYYFPFVCLGYCINRFSLENYIKNNGVFLLFICVFILLVPYYNRVFAATHVRLLIAISGSVSVWRICEGLYNDNRINKFLTYLGKNSMSIYCIHGLLMTKTIIDIPIHQWAFWNFINIMIISVIICLVCIFFSKVISLSPILNTLFNGQLLKLRNNENKNIG